MIACEGEINTFLIKILVRTGNSVLRCAAPTLLFKLLSVYGKLENFHYEAYLFIFSKIIF